MGSDTIPLRSDGDTITDSWWNLLRDVLSGDFLPRNSSGIVTDQGGSIGSSSLRFSTAYLTYLRIMDGSYRVGFQAPSDLSENLIFTLPGAYAASALLPMLMSATGVISTGKLINLMLGSSGEQLSSSSGSYSSSSTGSWLDVTNLSVSLPVLKTSSSIVQVGLVGVGGGVSSSIYTNSDVSYRILRDATEIFRYRQNVAFQESVSAISHYDVGVAAGTYIYKVQAFINAGSVSITNAKLLARELI